MANDTAKIIGILIVAWLIFGQGQQTQVSPTNDGGDDNAITDGSCNYAPTFNLRANDKWDSTLTLSNAHQYQINDGDSTAFAGTAINNIDSFVSKHP